ncbi:MAG TPA: glycosyltransferase family 39 protein [Solirubrobacterales bacterium]|jgi:4-amino-4-deoxy-L-arabinose transferase-like glycosyltransferase|nr:glycosyltransferase family 39 protein [Solirubrobacterales bacterium]
MEVAGALGRGSLSTYREAVGAAVRARSRVFWIVAGLTVAAAALRFATLGVQSYHHDEIVTASRVLRDGFWHAMEAVGFSESAPPLYYVLAWLWTQALGTGELGLRSVSALAGVATVPVAYLLGAELSSRRAGIVAAALVAVNPMLLWYSQEARAYSLFVLLTALSLLYFVRALDRGRRRDFIAWGVASALALATHYFAAFPIAAEAIWLLRRRGREAAPGIGIIAAAGLLLAPLAIHQMSSGHAEWIGGRTLGHRLWETGLTFMLGETGDIIARPEHPLLALVPFLLVVVALTRVFARGDRRGRRAAGIPLAIGAVAVLVPVALGLLAPGKDYVLARNLMPALVPLLVAVAVGFTLRNARRGGAILAAALVAYSLGFSIWAGISPALQRPDWNSVAAALGEPRVPRAMVTWTLGKASLRYYLSTGSIQVQPSDGFRWWVGEVDFISDGPAPPPPRRLLGPGFRQVGYQQVGRLYLRRYATPGPGLRPLRLGIVRAAELGFRTNGVLLDGISPP